MGGKALNKLNIHTERKNTEEFFRIFNEISAKLSNDGIECDYVKFYRNKPTHGDLDVLIKIDHDFYNRGINLKKWVNENLESKGSSSNGSVLSFEYDNFQVDFIPVSEKNWNACRYFFNFDPVGNLTGKIAHKFGLKFGFEGLLFPFRNFNGRNSQNITISRDPQKIFDFLGLDFDRYNAGFSELQEIFDFVIDSKYFNYDNFLFENLNHIDRKRNEKRKTYNQFLEYVNENRENIPSYDGFKHKSEYIDDIDAYFPEANLKEKLAELKRKDAENKIMSERFNGHLIMEKLPNLKGKELGNAITNFKKSFGDNFRTYILSTSKETIINEFLKFYETIK